MESASADKENSFKQMICPQGLGFRVTRARSPLQVIFSDFWAQCRYYLYTWIPRVSMFIKVLVGLRFRGRSLRMKGILRRNSYFGGLGA